MTNEQNCSVLPLCCYIQEIKQTCYPPSSAIAITNTHAKIPEQQDLLDHTVSKILSIDSACSIEFKHFLLYIKWGCDGSYGRSRYKRKLPETTFFNANLFVSFLVPIKLIDNVTGAVV